MYKILVAEDEFINRRLLLKLLEPYGECTVAVDGLGALEEFKRALDKEEPFQIIFLDIVMPNLGGTDLLKRIREIESQRNIPENHRAIVIMTTAISDRQSVIQAAFNQCSAYLVKPVKQEALVKKLSALGINIPQPEEKPDATADSSQKDAPPTEQADVALKPKQNQEEPDDTQLPPEDNSGINPANLLDEEY